MRNNIIYTTDNANADVDEAYLFSFWHYRDGCVAESDHNLFFNEADRYVLDNWDCKINGMLGDVTPLEKATCKICPLGQRCEAISIGKNWGFPFRAFMKKARFLQATN